MLCSISTIDFTDSYELKLDPTCGCCCYLKDNIEQWNHKVLLSQKELLLNTVGSIIAPKYRPESNPRGGAMTFKQPHARKTLGYLKKPRDLKVS